MLVKNPVMGRVLLSSPFAVYGGILADSGEARTALSHAAEALGREFEVQHVELRNAHEEQCTGLARVSRYVTFTQEISPDAEAILEAIPRKTRAAVRKSFRYCLELRASEDPRAFEDLYARSLRRLGTPCFPSRHYAELRRNFGDAVDIREVIHKGAPVAAVMTFYFRDRVLPFYGASDPAFNEVQPNNFMYYELMRWGGANGYRLFDFGRSKMEGSGSYDFKAHWGMAMRELPYEVILVRRKQLPNFSPNNPKFSLAIRAWQKMPLPLTRWIGPALIRLVP